MEVKYFFFHSFRHIHSIEGNLSLSQLGNIERLQEVIVERGILLGKTEGFVGLPFFVDIAEIGFPIQTVIALRGKDEPPAVR